MMHDSMPCDPIIGQGHVALKVKKFSHFQNLFHPPFSIGAGK